MIEPYGVVAIQSIVRNVYNKNSREKTLRETINRNLSIIDYTAARHGGPKLFVLPEFSLTGSNRNRTVEEWSEIAIQIPGPETKLIGECARDLNVYIAGANYEYDPEWPNRYWNTAFIIDPNGEVILRYRKLNGGNLMGHLNYSTPGGAYTEYVRRYGREGIFPVVDTPIGKLACLVCYDINFPEVTRALAMRGAEVIIHPTGEPYGAHREGWEMAKRTRAYENTAYVVTANHGAWMAAIDEDRWTDSGGLLFQEGRRPDIYPSYRSHGLSEIINYDGRVLAAATGPGECVIQANIDVESLRERRDLPSGFNFMVHLRSKMYAPGYAAKQAAVNDEYLEKPMVNRSEGTAYTRGNIKRMIADGILAEPNPAIKPWGLACIQSDIKMWKPGQDRDEIVFHNLRRGVELAEEAVRRGGAKLVLFPEFWLQGFMYGGGYDTWRQICIEVDGREVQELQEAAAKLGVYMCGAFFEWDKEWPERWWNTAIIIDDSGKLIHRYRKTNGGNLVGISPVGMQGDVYSEYVKRYGYEGLWPVAETPLGRLATEICYDMNFAETARMMALHGAEVLLHPTGEPHGAYRPQWHQSRIARAYENNIYVASANHGSVSNTSLPEWRSRGHSCIVDYTGSVIALIDSPGEAVVTGQIDINSMRRLRTSTGSKLSHVRTGIFAAEYAGTELCPTDLFLAEPQKDRAEGPAILKQNITRLQQQGIFTAPDRNGAAKKTAETAAH